MRDRHGDYWVRLSCGTLLLATWRPETGDWLPMEWPQEPIPDDDVEEAWAAGVGTQGLSETR